MTEEKQTCKRCSSDVALAKLDPFSGEDAGVKLTIEGMPAYVCTRGHKRFLYPEMPARLMEALMKSDNAFGAPPATEKGFLMKHLHCPGCKAQLPKEPASRATLNRTLELKNTPPFSVSIEVPQWRCTECGKDAVGPADKLGPSVMQAGAMAFRGADIPPG